MKHICVLVTKSYVLLILLWSVAYIMEKMSSFKWRLVKIKFFSIHIHRHPKLYIWCFINPWIPGQTLLDPSRRNISGYLRPSDEDDRIDLLKTKLPKPKPKFSPQCETSDRAPRLKCRLNCQTEQLEYKYREYFQMKIFSQGPYLGFQDSPLGRNSQVRSSHWDTLVMTP